MAEAAEAALGEAKAAEVAAAEAASGEAESGARAAVALMDKWNELFKEQQTIALKEILMESLGWINIETQFSFFSFNFAFLTDRWAGTFNPHVTPLPHMRTTAVPKLIANASFHDLTQSSQMDGSTNRLMVKDS